MNANVLPSTKSNLICKFYLQNRCYFGKNCRFRHDDNDVGVQSMTSSVYARNNPPPPPTDACLPITRNYTSPKNARYSNPRYIEMAEEAKKKQMEDAKLWRQLEGPFYSIDVECVAIGNGWYDKDRYPCRVSLVDGIGECVLDSIIKLEGNDQIVSYLTPLTGVTKEICEEKGRPLQEVVEQVKSHLSIDAVIVGQSIEHDIKWLGLVKGKDYKDSFDIALMFRQALPDLKSLQENSSLSPAPIYYRCFSLRHTCLHLLFIDIQKNEHDPVIDARYSMKLFQKYKDSGPSELRAIRDTLNRAPVTSSFAKSNPLIDGVCMNARSVRIKYSARRIWRWYRDLHKNY